MASVPHHALNRSISLAEVHIQVFYFVPKDRIDLLWADWASSLRATLELMRAFHRLQFGGSSELTYEIVSAPVIGELAGEEYDGTSTDRGNRHAWDSIGEELTRRYGNKPTSSDAFPIRLVLYEGVGALGGENQILVSAGYLQNPHVRTYAPSVFYHELGHTFGLSDAYQYGHDTPIDEDIMGLGRTRPLGETYLSAGEKKQLGIN